MDYETMVTQLLEARSKFDSLPKPNNDKEFIDRIGRGGELLGALKAISCIMTDNKARWKSFLLGTLLI